MIALIAVTIIRLITFSLVSMFLWFQFKNLSRTDLDPKLQKTRIALLLCNISLFLDNLIFLAWDINLFAIGISFSDAPIHAIVIWFVTRLIMLYAFWRFFNLLYDRDDT